MSATITKGGTLPDSSNKSDFYALIDTATITGIINAEIAAEAAIADTKLATITYAKGGTGLTALGTALQVLRTNAGETAIEWGSGGMAYTDTRFKVGSFTRDTATATGTQAITGVGFSPKVVLFFMAEPNVTGEMSMGVDDGTTRMEVADRHNIGADQWTTGSGVAIFDLETAANYYTGVISSMDADGFTISWTKTGSPTGTLTITYLALR